MQNRRVHKKHKSIRSYRVPVLVFTCDLASFISGDGDIVEFEDVTGITPYNIINTDMIKFTISYNGR